MTADFKKWKNDPRLHNLDSERLSKLLNLSERLASVPNEQKMTEFLKIHQEAEKQHMVFTPDEQDILVTILTENMSAEEKAKVQMIRKLALRIQKN